MKFYIDWNFLLAVTNQQKCDKVMTKIANLLGTAFSEVKSERYWKEKALYKVRAHSTFDASNSKDALDATMRTIGLLSPAWIVVVPSDDESWEFGGTSSPGAVSLQGIDSISFSASQEQQNAVAEAV